MDEAQWKTEQLRLADEARLRGRTERATRTKVHGIIPGHFFSAASTECRELFIDGHYYGCISLSQAVAEALVRYLGDVQRVGARKDPAVRAVRLHKKGAVSKTAADAFQRIWSHDRNAFHHINETIPTDPGVLEQLAEDCVNALYEIESDVFAFDIVEGALVPKHLIYWPKEDSEHLKAFLRLGGY